MFPENHAEDVVGSIERGEVVVISNFIANEHIPSTSTLPDINPATDVLIAQVPCSSVDEVKSAIGSAHAACNVWANTPFEERAACLRKWAVLLEERTEFFAKIESFDTGKPLWLCNAVDIPRAVHNLKFFAEAICHNETACHLRHDAVNYTQRSPIGCVGLITPWNLPLYLLTWKLGPALAMGNTIVAKPSELTPLTAHLLAYLAVEAGFPAGVVNVVSGLGAEAGQALVEDPRVKMISFTGGTLTGKRVNLTCAPLFKKVSLELGGKNATIVFADCAFDRTVSEVVRSSFLNQGQICLCGSRIFVERCLYDKFVAAFVLQTKELKVGDPLSKDSFLGSLISKDHREKVESYVQLAIDEGGEILCGGGKPMGLDSGAFYLPTVVGGLSPSSRCATEEIFGPVVTIHAFDTEEEVLSYHDCVPYGLAGSVWTSDLSRGHRVAQSMDTGMVWVNCWLYRDLRVPFGGVKSSGIGKEGGWESLSAFSTSKNICIKL